MAKQQLTSEVKMDRQDIVLIGLLFALVLSGVFMRYEQVTNRTLVDKFETMKAENDRNKKYNSNLDTKIQQSVVMTGTQEVKKDSEIVYSKLFDWSSWSEYVANMRYLRSSYPLLEKDKVVDVSGRAAGTGTAPSSSYSSNYFQSENYGTLINLVKVQQETADSTSSGYYEGIAKMDNGQFKVSVLQPYVKKE